MDKLEIFKRDNFSCQKCGFRDTSGKELEIHCINQKISSEKNNSPNLITLCSICQKYSPTSEKEFKKYIQEKIDNKMIETFRKSEYSISKKTLIGMNQSFKKGNHISKAPKGYKFINKELIIDDKNAEEVRQIFKEFAESNISLTQLSKKYNLTTSGLIKLLKNITYLGKVKFSDRESEGRHVPIIDKKLFERAQEKLNN